SRRAETLKPDMSNEAPPQTDAPCRPSPFASRALSIPTADARLPIAEPRAYAAISQESVPRRLAAVGRRRAVGSRRIGSARRIAVGRRPDPPGRRRLGAGHSLPPMAVVIAVALQIAVAVAVLPGPGPIAPHPIDRPRRHRRLIVLRPRRR